MSEPQGYPPFGYTNFIWPKAADAARYAVLTQVPLTKHYKTHKERKHPPFRTSWLAFSAAPYHRVPPYR